MAERQWRNLSREEYLALSHDDRLDYEAFEFMRSRKAQAERSMEYWDKQPKAVRALIHEFGAGVVQTFIQCGVTDPAKVRRIAYALWGIQPETGGVAHRGNRGKGSRHVDRAFERSTLPAAYRK